jgi:hypothetical protein
MCVGVGVDDTKYIYLIYLMIYIIVIYLFPNYMYGLLPRRVGGQHRLPHKGRGRAQVGRRRERQGDACYSILIYVNRCADIC